jgi:hypothetical protein
MPEFVVLDRGLVDRISGLLDAVAARSLRPQDSLSTALRAFGQDHEGAELAELLEQVQGAWISRISSYLSDKKRSALEGILSAQGPDLLGVFRKGSDENSHSDVLRWLLDPRVAPTVAPGALLSLIERFDAPASWKRSVEGAIQNDMVSVRREYVIGREWTGDDERDRIDILISGPGFVIAVENKIWAQEHSSQTKTYWRWLEPLTSLRAGIFLTPAGYAAECASFHSLSYLGLLSCLLESRSREIAPSPEEEIVLTSYIRSVAVHVLRVELRSLGTTSRKGTQ